MLENVFGVELSHNQRAIIENIHKHDHSVLILPREFGRNHILAMYMLERAILEPGKRIVVFAAAWRHSKSLGEYVESVLHKSDMIKFDCRHDLDQWQIKLGKSRIVFQSVGDGARVRGERPHIMIGLNASSIDQQIRDAIIAGVGVVNDGAKVILSDYEEYLSDRFEQEVNEWQKTPTNYVCRISP